MKHLLIYLLLISSVSFGQRLRKADKAIINNLKSSITYLSSDQMLGRRTGTEGEKLAYHYLSDEFKKIGLIPKGDANTYLQTFEINEGKQMMPQTYLSINGTALTVGEDFFPFIFSANAEITSFASPAIKENNAPWFFDIKEILQENANNPHFDLEGAIKDKAIAFAGKGASALIVFNSSSIEDELKFEGKSKAPALKIPIIFLTKKAAEKYLNEKTADLQLAFKVAIGDKIRTGTNVIGFIDNGAANTVIIGAHYDHLGYGEDHNSLWAGKPQIHNGADDNASGTASVLELAKLLKDSKLDNSNYLFICFSGEELGLFGSKYFTMHPTIPLDKINYMINLDMVGRLKENSSVLTIGGFGTSPAWGNFLPEKTKAFTVNFDSSGIGPSDHTSFYLKNIPVLFFFTGTHADYHKPTDDVEKINFTGEFRIIKYIYDIIKETDDMNKLVFSKTREPQKAAARFTVSLGFMPDYTFSGVGVRVDGVIDGKVAAKVGIKSGDIIKKIGNHQVTDIYSYMDVLSKFKKEDATKVTVERQKQKLTFDIVF